MPQGFTLIEILVVAALFAGVAGYSLAIPLSTYPSMLSGEDARLDKTAQQWSELRALEQSCVAVGCREATARAVYRGATSTILFEEPFLEEPGTSDAIRFPRFSGLVPTSIGTTIYFPDGSSTTEP